jgi:hypothetical protein
MPKITIPIVSREEADEVRRAGTAWVGGMWSPPAYDAAYLTVARWTLERARAEDEALAAAGRPATQVDHVSMAVFYLQRHCLELLYKSLIDGAMDVMKYTAIHACRPEGGAEHAKLEEKLRACGHRFQQLIDLAEETLVNGAGHEMPVGMNDLAREFIAHEDGDETRFRYSLGIRGKYRNAKSFPLLTQIPVGGLQSRLESVAVQCDDGEPDGEGLLRDLYNRVNSIANVLYSEGRL